MPQPQPDRRRAPRAQADFPIRLTEVADASPARLKDISEIGLCCVSENPLDEMTLLGIDLKLPGAQIAHRVKGAVVRCEPMPKGEKGYEIAVYFTEVPETTRGALRQYVAVSRPA
ncbi:MAG: hypothetical protein Fur0037_18520 [Planctomycetota bacterium]